MDTIKSSASAPYPRPEKPTTAVCDGCGSRFPRSELAEVQESLTYFEGDLLREECWHGSDAVVL